MVFQFLRRQLGSPWTAKRHLLVLLGLVVLLARCSTGGNSGSLSPSSDPSPQVEEQAVKSLLQEYRTALLREDIDRLQELLRPTDVPPQVSAFAQQRGLRQENGLFMGVEAFRENKSIDFRTLTVTDLDIPDAEIRVSSDRRSVSFLEVESILETENRQDLATLVQRTRSFRTTFRLARDEEGGVVTFRIAAARREGPLFQVTTRGQVLAGALARVEVIAGSWPIRGGEAEVPETGVIQALVAAEDIFHGLFTPPAQPDPQPLLVRLRGDNGEEIVLRHRYQLRVLGEGVVQRIVGTGSTRFFAVTLAPDGTAWFGGEIASPETEATICVGNVIKVTAECLDNPQKCVILQPVINQRPNETVTSARIEDIVIDQLGRGHFIFIAQNADERVVGNGDIVLDPNHGGDFCQTVNTFDASV